MNLAGKKAPSRTLTGAVSGLRDAGHLAAVLVAVLGASPALVGCGSDGPAKSTGLGGTSVGGAGGGAGGSGFPTGPIDLCDGLVQDLQPHPMTTLAKPAVGAAVTEPQFGTQIRRITGVASGSDTPAIVPLYSTVSAWNADESRLLLLNIVASRHELWDGKSYTFIRSLEEINPPDVEQVFWHTTDPDVFLYVEGKDFIRYHVTDARKEKVTTFSMCSGGNPTGGDDPMFSAFDSNRFAFHCGGIAFTYDLSSNSVLGMKTISEAIQMAPSGTLTYGSVTGTLTDAALNVVRKLDLADPGAHASMGRWPTGEDTWNGLVYDPGPMGDQAIGSVVVWDMAHFVSKVVVGPDTGFPYPRDGHVSALAYRQPGWVFLSTYGNTSGAGLLDEENVIADTVSGKVCRVGRHRSWGKGNTHVGDSYWAEAHTVPSPSGTRAIFGSDWGNGTTIDSYVVELPSYHR